MSELQTMQDALDIVKDIQIGDLVQGEVLTLQDKQAIVGIIGGGVEGVIPFNELSTSPVERVEDVLSVGDVVDLVVIKQIKDKENGSFLLSKKRVDARKVWEEIQAKFDNKEIIEAPVVDAVKGGLVVDAGVRAFVPASMVSDHYVDNLAQFFESIQEGSVVTGKVARLTNFGAFIDLGGVDGLVHISQISHEHVAKASDKLEVGQEVQAKVISVDPESGRVSLSILSDDLA